MTEMIMERRNGPGKIDWLIALGCVTLTLMTLAVVGESGRGRAGQAVCLANLKQLTSAWLSYAEANDDKLVNGAAGIDRISLDKRETAWVGQCWASDFLKGGQLAPELHRFNIQRGALWPYVGEIKLYRCPDAHPDHMLTYAIVGSMNGLNAGRSGVSAGNRPSGSVGVRVGDTVLWLQKTSEIVSPPAAERMVLIDDGMAMPDSFGTHYRYEMWWDYPPVRHGDGTDVSFADGHCEDWQWRGEETIRNGRTLRGPVQRQL